MELFGIDFKVDLLLAPILALLVPIIWNFASIMYPIFKTSKTTFLIPPLYDTNGNSFTPFESELLTA